MLRIPTARPRARIQACTWRRLLPRSCLFFRVCADVGVMAAVLQGIWRHRGILKVQVRLLGDGRV